MHCVKRFLLSVVFCVPLLMLPVAHAGDTGESKKTSGDEVRTLEGYVEQEKEFYDFLKNNHPIFRYEKDGRLVG